MELTPKEDFENWIETARAGAVSIYYRGRLDLDRGSCIGAVFVPVPAVDKIAHLAYRAFEEKRIHLFQRKLHDNCYEYIAMKRSRYGRNW